jgi:hypothetical protein
MRNLITFFCRNYFSKESFTRIRHPKTILLRILLISVILATSFLSGCNYYFIKSSAYPKAEEVNPLLTQNRVYVVHADKSVFVLKKFRLENDSIKGDYLDQYFLPEGQTTFPEVNSSHRYYKGNTQITREVHFWVPSSEYSEYKTNAYALKDIFRFDIYSHNKNATSLSWVFGILGGCVALPILFFLMLLMVGLLGGSCPYIYVNNGSEFELTGDIYSGAVYAPLERNDYLNLPRLVSEDGKYLLKISNELMETQFNNLTELLVIDHPVTSKVLIDKYGNYQTNTDNRQPLTATNALGTDILEAIKKRDSLSYIGPLTAGNIPAIDGVTLSFDHPAGASKAKLFIRAKNSPWLENVYKNIYDLLGGYDKKWFDKQNRSDGTKLRESMLSQKIPLSVYVEKDGKWIFCDYYNLVGPLSMKDDVIEIDMKGIPGGPCKIKLESGAFFWNIDYVGIDFSDNTPVNIASVRLEKAVDENEDIVTDLLKYDDLKYYVQDKPFNSADLTFSVPPVKGDQRTVILHSKGYYQMNHEGKGIPKIMKLRSIRKPGHFPEYSAELLRSALLNTKFKGTK